MRKKIFIATFLIASILGAEEDALLQKGAFLKYGECKEIAKSYHDSLDCLVLLDGTKLQGILEKLPPIVYSFDRLKFSADELMAIAVVRQNNITKLQYVTHDGQNYVGKWNQDKFIFWTKEPTLKNPDHVVEKEIDPQTVNFIILTNRTGRSFAANQQLASLELVNGDQLPILIMSNPITLTGSSWSDKKIQAKDVLEIFFNGGVHGQIYEKGIPKDLPFMYAKDPYLLIQIPHTHHLIKLPWTLIAHVQGYNGGFQQDKGELDSANLRHSLFHEKEVSIFRTGNFEPKKKSMAIDSIGITGDLLSGVLIASVITPRSISVTQQLGLEPIIASKALFDEDETSDWANEIVLEDIIEDIISEDVILEDIISENVILDGNDQDYAFFYDVSPYEEDKYYGNGEDDESYGLEEEDDDDDGEEDEEFYQDEKAEFENMLVTDTDLEIISDHYYDKKERDFLWEEDCDESLSFEAETFIEELLE